ncbi:uncharacterized protein LOC120270333 [Dioscorea cayenensis subsp. rotundata]|uniref:Uncharacterized protein LOC120270333 n=1 Tax=Dioscorea cayennensis subsp. rotundata TaxID=55577 RepID=A0AB40C312_DIOCR|nr:uncharacterized protein LOC120270333 [Dioscorea cayenensis subsp. rotundata]
MENEKDDAKALFLLQQAISETIFHRIVRFNTAKEAWIHIKNENQGTSKMVSMRQQTLRQKFDLLQMKEEEIIQDYITRVLVIVNQIRGMGVDLADADVVSKVIRSLSSKFVHAVTSIEEAREISTLTLEDLSSSLQAHEERYNQFLEKQVERAFVMRGGASSGRNYSRGRGRSWRGRGRGFDDQRSGNVGIQNETRQQGDTSGGLWQS